MDTSNGSETVIHRTTFKDGEPIDTEIHEYRPKNTMMQSGMTRKEVDANRRKIAAARKKALEEEIRDGVNYIEVKAFVSGDSLHGIPNMIDIKVKGMFPSQARRLVKFLKEEL